MLLRCGDLALFVQGFAKIERGKLRRNESATFSLLADAYLALDATGLAAAQAYRAIVCGSELR